MPAIYPDLEGQSVLITGGGSGIGEAITRAFARQKCKVGFIDIAGEPSVKLCEELAAAGADVHFEKCDITDTPALQAAIKAVAGKIGTITVLVNNAAHDQRHRWEDVTPEYWDERIGVNIKHQFFAAQAVAPGMIEAGKGSIINMGSTSWMIGQGGMACYTASKSAVVGLTRSLARDLGVHNIRVNTVAPGAIMTQRQLDLWIDEAAKNEIIGNQCLKRLLVPDDVAKAVLFFASEDAGACTNQSYVVDGGWI